MTHLALDIFGAYTPLLWPISNQSIEILTSLTFHTGTHSYLILDLGLGTAPYHLGAFESIDAPVITASGLAISLVLLIPCLIPLIHARRHTAPAGKADSA